MTEKVELKPCPFCGGRAKFSKDGEQKVKYGNEQIYCTQCFITAAPQETEQEAVDWWNTRASAHPATEWVSVADNFPENVRWVKVKIDNPNSERQYTSIARYIRACAPFEWRFTNGEQVERPDFGITVLAWQECERNMISGPMEILFTPKETTV